MPALNALSLSGRFNVMVATPPAISNKMVSNGIGTVLNVDTDCGLACVPAHRSRNRTRKIHLMAYENILVETRGKVGIVTLNRPQAMNALSPALMRELGAALTAFENDEAVGAMVITGSEKAFAAGADIKAMKDWGYMDVYKSDYITAEWETVTRCRKAVIAAVSG